MFYLSKFFALDSNVAVSRNKMNNNSFEQEGPLTFMLYYCKYVLSDAVKIKCRNIGVCCFHFSFIFYGNS